MSQVHLDSRKSLQLLFALVLGLFLPSIVLAAGYPNRDTVVLGDQGSLAPQYELSLSAPDQVMKGEHFDVHASAIATDGLISRSVATVTTSNGTVLSEPEIELLPENVWSLTTDEVGTLGVIVKIQTAYYASKDSTTPQVTFVDTLEKRIVVQAVAVQGESQQPTMPSTRQSSGWWFWPVGAVIIIAIIVGIILRRKKARRAVDNKG